MVHMGVLQTSKNQALLVTDSTKVQDKGTPKGKDLKASNSNPKENHKTSEGASGSKKKNKIDKKICPYCTRVSYLEDQCMKKQIDQLLSLLKHNNISLPQRAKKPDDEPQPKDDESCHALKAILVQ